MLIAEVANNVPVAVHNALMILLIDNSIVLLVKMDMFLTVKETNVEFNVIPHHNSIGTQTNVKTAHQLNT